MNEKLVIDLTGRVALVTGASRGLGRAIALTLGRAGARVAVTDLLVETEKIDTREAAKYGLLAGHFAGTDVVRTKATADEIAAAGGQARAFKMDVTRRDEIARVVGEISDSLGEVDVLVNNAAVMDNFGFLEAQDPELWERDIRINLTGAFNCIRAVWPGMVKKQWGRVITLSSIAGQMGAYAQPSYGASKAGLVGLTRSLALEGARHGVTVNAVLPGLIDTEAVKLQKPDMKERFKDRIAMKRLGEPEEVASVVAFLASGMSGYITGAAIPVTGGVDLLTF